jgi:hypothetical protein
MSTQVIHQPRVAYDTARAIVSVAVHGDRDSLARLAARVGELFGPEYRRALLDTRRSVVVLGRPDMPMVETGVWRVRLEDLLRARPQLAEEMRALG